jgi:hypothetical protein
MSPERLSILYVSHIPPSPPRFGAQAGVHGLITELARRHDLTAAMLVDDELEPEECLLVRNPYGLTERLLLWFVPLGGT